jgi:fructokinase
VRRYGGIEAGGTKFVCGVSDEDGNILNRVRFPTAEPVSTIGRAVEFFQNQAALESIGIASFGPIDRSTGHIGNTPKPGWRHVDFAARIEREIGVRVEFDTDVNGAALAEQRWGAAQGINDFVYITVGTGIGGGVMVNGRLAHGHMHTELGHMRVPHDRAYDPYGGSCSFHGDCLEGLACGVAMMERWQVPAETLPPEHAAWMLEAGYLAQCVSNLACVLSTELVIFGGGVGNNPHLHALIRQETSRLLNGYISTPQIRMPGLGDDAGLLGAIALAQLSVKRAAGAI